MINSVTKIKKKYEKLNGKISHFPKACPPLVCLFACLFVCLFASPSSPSPLNRHDGSCKIWAVLLHNLLTGKCVGWGKKSLTLIVSIVEWKTRNGKAAWQILATFGGDDDDGGGWLQYISHQLYHHRNRQGNLVVSSLVLAANLISLHSQISFMMDRMFVNLQNKLNRNIVIVGCFHQHSSSIFACLPFPSETDSVLLVASRNM